MSDKKKIKVGEVFNHPNLGLVRYISNNSNNMEYGEPICELKLVNCDDFWSRWPYWTELYDLGFELEL